MSLNLSRQRGIGLIEVLVSLLVLSIGVLGLAAMQATGLKQSRQAFYHTQATVLAYDLIDRMRANDAAAANGNYAVAYGTFSATACTTGCSSAQIADNDKLEWKASLAAQLPAGDGRVVNQNNGRFDISIRWTDGDGLSAPLTIGIQL